MGPPGRGRWYRRAMVIRLGIPKGSLQDATFKLFAKAGWILVRPGDATGLVEYPLNKVIF